MGIESLLVFCAFVLVLAGFVKGAIGLGLPTISMGLLGLVMAPLEAAALLVVPNLVTNVWQLMTGPSFRALLLRLWPTMAGIAFGTLAGQALMPNGSSAEAVVYLGIALFAYGVLGLAAFRWHVSPNGEVWLGPLFGIATGIVTIATGVFVIPAVPYLQALGLDKEVLVQALGLSFLTSTIALALVLATAGPWGAAFAAPSLLALVPALAGMFLGQALRNRIGQETFRRCFFAGIALLGAFLAAKPWL